MSTSPITLLHEKFISFKKIQIIILTIQNSLSETLPPSIYENENTSFRSPNLHPSCSNERILRRSVRSWWNFGAYALGPTPAAFLRSIRWNDESHTANVRLSGKKRSLRIKVITLLKKSYIRVLYFILLQVWDISSMMQLCQTTSNVGWLCKLQSNFPRYDGEEGQDRGRQAGR